MQNKTILITYADSIGNNLNDLNIILKKYLKGIVNAIHILPFYPSTSDRGFSPTTYDYVDEKFGTWDDIEDLAKDYQLIFDFMINHISKHSRFFRDFEEKKENSPYYDLFIKYREFWPEGKISKENFDKIYKRKDFSYVEVNYNDGTSDKLWSTFTNNQIDIDFRKDITKKFIKNTLTQLAQRGANMIRLDAVAYTTKRPGTSCFFVEPEIWDVLEYSKECLKPYGVDILPELHEHYTLQKKLSDNGNWVYDFVLPMLLIHTLYSGSNKRLLEWLSICPSNQFTTLDTHDGIGVVDVKGILSDEEINTALNNLYTKGVNVKKEYNSTIYNNVDTYQINCTYYSALGNNDKAYLLARAIQFFTPGIPQIYYVGLFAGENDIELLEKTKEGRNINRHYYSKKEIETEVEKPVVKKLFSLIKFRNEYEVFDGNFEILETNSTNLLLSWTKGNLKAVLDADLETYEFSIEYYDEKTRSTKIFKLNSELKTA